MPLHDLRLGDLKELAREDLNAALSKLSVAGDKSKAVLVEKGLYQTLTASGLTSGCLTEANGVRSVAELDVRETVDTDVRMLVILVRPSLPLMNLVATVVRRCQEHYRDSHGRNDDGGSGTTLHVRVLFVPKKTFICCHLLESELGLSRYEKYFEIGQVELDFFPVEEDALSMQMPDLFRDIFMDGDTTALQFIAKTLIKLQTGKLGLIPKFFAKGNIACRTLDFVRRMTADVGVDFMQEQASVADRLYLVDRAVDLTTPLLTQLTYEGMLDEQMGLVCGTCKPPMDIKDLKKADPNGILRATNASDEIYYAVRDLNFSQVGSVLHEKSLSVKADYDRRKELQMREICDFMKRVPEKSRLVSVHTEIATYLAKIANGPAFRRRTEMEQLAVQGIEDKEVLEYVEELLNKGEPMVAVLRFLCLMSVTSNGLKPKLHDQLKEAFQMSYGIPQTLVAWYNLERAGLLTKSNASLLAQAGALASLGQYQLKGRDGRVPFSGLRKACRLWVENLNEKSPNDVAYAYSGYAPLLLRTVEGLDQYAIKLQRSGAAPPPQGAMRSGASGGGGVVNPNGSSAKDADNNKQLQTGIPALDAAPGDVDTFFTGAEVAGSTKTVVIFVIGGVTSAEVNAIRRILGNDPELDGERAQYVVLSTSITNGSQLIKSMLPFDP